LLDSIFLDRHRKAVNSWVNAAPPEMMVSKVVAVAAPNRTHMIVRPNAKAAHNPTARRDTATSSPDRVTSYGIVSCESGKTERRVGSSDDPP
jgi:uncharacterized cupin superfamily protein